MNTNVIIYDVNGDRMNQLLNMRWTSDKVETDMLTFNKAMTTRFKYDLSPIIDAETIFTRQILLIFWDNDANGGKKKRVKEFCKELFPNKELSSGVDTEIIFYTEDYKKKMFDDVIDRVLHSQHPKITLDEVTKTQHEIVRIVADES